MIDYVTLLKGLGENLIILLSLPFIYHLSNSKLARRTIKKQGLLVGLLFGLIAVIGMLFSVKLRPGVFMDGRIIVAIAGLFGGACSAVPAIIMILLCQFWIGGEWMLPGMGASISGAILGVLAHWGFKNKFEQIRSHHLLLLGFLLGATGWVWNLGYRDESIQSFFMQVMVLYPLSTLILSHLILNEKKRSAFEQALAQSEKEYRTLVDEMPDIRYRSDLDGNISFVSKAGYAMFGYTPAEAIGMNLTKIYVDPKERKNYITQLQEKGEVSDFQTQLRHKDGTIRWGSTNARLFRDSQGEPIGIEGITRDVTRSKRRDDLKAAQLRLVEYGMNHSVVQILQKITDEAEALTNSGIGFFHFLEEDQNSILRQAWSTRTHQHCGSDVHQFHYPVEEAGRWADCIRSRQPVIQNNYQALSHKSGLPEGHTPLERFMVVPIIREDKVKAILGLGNKAFDYDDLDEDILRQLATFAWEIVVRKQAEKALLDREAKLRAVFDQTYQLMGLFSTNGTYLAVNRAAIEFCGFGESELQSYVLWDSPWWRHSEKEQKRGKEAFFKALSGEFLRFETTNLDRRGRTRILDASMRPIFNEDKEVVFVCVEGRDITKKKEAEEEKKALEAQLLQSQKLEAIGTLAGGVAHDFNNILSAIIGFVELAQEDIEKDNPVKYYIDQISKAGYRASDLVEQILLFSRQSDQNMKSVDVMILSKEVIRLLRSTIPKNIEIKTRFSAENAMVMSAPSQIHQILMNLCTNSIHAMGKKSGTLSIFLDNISLDQEAHNQWPDLKPGHFLKLEICDTGHGIPDDIITRVFDPFFSTKPREEGSGLGLAVVHGIVKKHGGGVRIKSRPDKGTDVCIYLPQIKTSNPRSASDNLTIPGGNEHLLFVEDELPLIEFGTQMLQRLGYQVTAVSDSSKAWDIFSKDPDQFNLVVTDNQMPVMNGLTLAEKILVLNPQTHILMCTGFGDDLTVNQAQKVGIKEIIYKPIIKEKMAFAIRRILDESLAETVI